MPDHFPDVEIRRGFRPHTSGKSRNRIGQNEQFTSTVGTLADINREGRSESRDIVVLDRLKSVW